MTGEPPLFNTSSSSPLDAPLDFSDHYAVLHVSPYATAADIGRAYRSRSLLVHPDKQASADAATAERNSATFQQLTDAYEVLSDATRRQQYDQQRRGQLLTRPTQQAHCVTPRRCDALDRSPPSH